MNLFAVVPMAAKNMPIIHTEIGTVLAPPMFDSTITNVRPSNPNIPHASIMRMSSSSDA